MFYVHSTICECWCIIINNIHTERAAHVCATHYTFDVHLTYWLRHWFVCVCSGQPALRIFMPTTTTTTTKFYVQNRVNNVKAGSLRIHWLDERVDCIICHEVVTSLLIIIVGATFFLCPLVINKRTCVFTLTKVGDPHVFVARIYITVLVVPCAHALIEHYRSIDVCAIGPYKHTHTVTVIHRMYCINFHIVCAKWIVVIFLIGQYNTVAVTDKHTSAERDDENFYSVDQIKKRCLIWARSQSYGTVERRRTINIGQSNILIGFDCAITITVTNRYFFTLFAFFFFFVK